MTKHSAAYWTSFGLYVESQPQSNRFIRCIVKDMLDEREYAISLKLLKWQSINILLISVMTIVIVGYVGTFYN